jgi:hypothetical protein
MLSKLERKPFRLSLTLFCTIERCKPLRLDK